MNGNLNPLAKVLKIGGIPALAIGVFYLLMDKFNFSFGKIENQTYTTLIVIVAIVAITLICTLALLHYKNNDNVTKVIETEGANILVSNNVDNEEELIFNRINGKKTNVILFDLDGTLIQGENFNYLYESLRKRQMTFMVRCGQNRIKILVCPWQFLGRSLEIFRIK